MGYMIRIVSRDGRDVAVTTEREEPVVCDYLRYAEAFIGPFTHAGFEAVVHEVDDDALVEALERIEDERGATVEPWTVEASLASGLSTEEEDDEARRLGERLAGLWRRGLEVTSQN